MLLEDSLPALAPLIFDVVDVVYGPGSVFKQQARITELNVKLLLDGCCEVRMVMEPQYFASETDGTAGAAVPAGTLNRPPVIILANGRCAVDPAQDGKPMYRLISAGYSAGDVQQPGTARNMVTGLVETFEPGQSWPDFIRAKPEALMMQDRLFGEMLRSQVVMADKLLEYGLLADAAPSSFA